MLELVSQLKPDYDDISTHCKLENHGRLVGEVDILARKGDEVHLFEVKCSYRIIKAKRQLSKMRKSFTQYHTKCFFYCGGGKTLIEVM